MLPFPLDAAANPMNHKRTIRRLLGGAVALAATQASLAATVVFQHARVIDGSGARPLDDVTLVVTDGRIGTMRTGVMLKMPAGTTVVDARGKTILPGLISDHSHLGITDGTNSQPKNYNRENIQRELRQWQRYGVTTVNSLGLNQPLFYELQRETHAGTLAGADIFGADRGIGVADGAPPMDVAEDQVYRPATPEEARRDVDEMAARKPDFIKVWVDDFHHSVPRKMPPAMYLAVIDEAHGKGLRVAAHVYYLKDAKQLVSDGADVIAHGVRDAPVDDAFIALLRQKGAWYIPTLGLDESFYAYAERSAWTQTTFVSAGEQPALAAQFADPAWQAKALEPKALAMNKASLKTNQANLKRLYDAGVHIGFGTDSGATPLRIPGVAEHRELKLIVDAGLTPLQAIALATGNAARLLKLDDRGTIAPGKRADLLIVDGDPSVDIAVIDRIDSVWQNGIKVAGPLR
jgi:imidazolonepropionase-like amidohydrolase